MFNVPLAFIHLKNLRQLEKRNRGRFYTARVGHGKQMTPSLVNEAENPRVENEENRVIYIRVRAENEENSRSYRSLIVEFNDVAARVVTDTQTHTQTDTQSEYCKPSAHARRKVNKPLRNIKS